MSTTQFLQVKTNIPNIGWRAYVFSRHIEVNGVCTPSPASQTLSLLSRQCKYNAGNSWYPGMPLEGIYPTIGQWVRVEWFDSNRQSYWVNCEKVVDIIDEATFNTGTCVSCYNQGVAGECSDTYGPFPDPNGCQYNNSINQTVNGTGGGIPVVPYTPFAPNYYVTTIVNNCSECYNPPNTPNGIRSCCDPTIQYTIATNNFLFTSNPLVYVGSSLVGDFVFPVGSTPPTTEYGCWEVVSDAIGPLVGTLGAGVILAFPDCYSIDLSGPHSPNIDVCCPPPIEDCDSYPLLPLNNRIKTFKISRDNLLNKGGKYTVKSILDLTGSAGDGTVLTIDGGGTGNPEGGGGSGGSGGGSGGDTKWSCEVGRCRQTPGGAFTSQEACISACGIVPGACCTWCCHPTDNIMPQECSEWMCDSCEC